MELKTDSSRILMSDILKGQVPELDDHQHDVDPQIEKRVIVVAETRSTSGNRSYVGILRSFLLGSDPEIEIRLDITDAFNIIEAPNVVFDKFTLQHEERLVPLPGPYNVKAVRLDEFSVSDQLCTISIQLKKLVR